MNKIQIPTALRPQTDGKSEVEVTGNSIKELLNSLNESYPELGKRLFKNESEINRYINIYVNDEDIRFLSGLDTEVKENDDVLIQPAISGG